MKKRSLYKIFLIILIIVLVINTYFILFNGEFILNNPNTYNVTEVGKNNNGTVYKIIAGDTSSKDTVGLIIGVHSREHEIHEAVNKTIYEIGGYDGVNQLSKRYILYYIVLNENITSKQDTRPAGETLAHQFIVPNIKSENPFIVVDIHEIDKTYEFADFIYPISNNSQANQYSDVIAKNLSIANFKFNEGTSPELVTIPISNQNITTLLFETSIENSVNEKNNIAKKLIFAIDKLKP